MLIALVVDPDDPDPVGRIPAEPVTFNAITAAHGKNKTARPFTDRAGIGDPARDAHAAGRCLASR